MEIWQAVLDFLGIFGGIGAFTIGISAWFGKLWAERILQEQVKKHNEAMARFSAELEKDVEKYKSQLDVIKESASRYSEYQFKLYNNLWGELYSLEFIANELWESANQQTLNKFVQQLGRTLEQVKKNALLIEKNHLNELLDLLNEFGDYQVGKKTLIEYKNIHNIRYINKIQIEELIEGNQNIKVRYTDILVILEDEFRHQMKKYQIT